MRLRPIRLLGAALSVLFASGLVHPASAQFDPRRGPPGCVPASERTMEVGCYILVSDPLGELPAVPLYWHLDSYPSRVAAEAAKGPRGTVVEALGQVWLMTIAQAGWRASGGEHVAEIGPLAVNAGMSYTAAYIEARSCSRARRPACIVTQGRRLCIHSPGKSAWRPLRVSSLGFRKASL